MLIFIDPENFPAKPARSILLSSPVAAYSLQLLERQWCGYLTEVIPAMC